MSRSRWLMLAAILVSAFFGPLAVAYSQQASSVRFITPDAATGSSRAVVVASRDLIHTAQILPLDQRGQLVGAGDASQQLVQLRANLVRMLATCDSKLSDIIKIQAYVADEQAAEAFRAGLAEQFDGPQKPAVTFVETALPHSGALVACDVVAVSGSKRDSVQRIGEAEQFGGLTGSAAAILPSGTQVYISGQAEQGDGSLADATRQTMASLGRTLDHLQLDRAHVVHIKAFLTPMNDVKEFERAVASFFPNENAPPVAVVQWQSSLPVEIEMVVAGPPGDSPPSRSLEYLTPPGMTASPVFARVTRFDSDTVIYLSGIYGTAADASAAEQVTSIFEQMQQTLDQAGSDLKHLAKATYYVATEDTSAQLNEQRPRYYDPQRPPAASKAIVAGVAQHGAGLTVDMIAIPK